MFTACQPDIAIVLDVSTSLGMDALNEYVMPFLESLFIQLTRMPSGAGDSTIGSQIYLTFFNKEATKIKFSTRGKYTTDMLENFRKIRVENFLDMGSCISCGLDSAKDQLLESGKLMVKMHWKEKNTTLISKNNTCQNIFMKEETLHDEIMHGNVLT